MPLGSADFLTDSHDAARNLAAEPAKIVQLRVGRVVRTIHPLQGQAEAVEVPIAANVNALQMA